jgi:hypothetical protein
MQRSWSGPLVFAALASPRYRAAMSKTLLALSATLVASAANAAVFDISDVRLGYTLVGNDVDTTVKAGPSSTTASDSWDSSHRVFLDLVLGTSTPLIGVAYGAGIAGDFKSADGTDYEAWSGHVLAGPYISLAVVRFELLPFVGFGQATLKQEAAGNEASNTAGYFEYGANLNVVATPPAIPLDAGVGVGWLNSSSEHDIDAASTTATYQVEGGNYTLSAFVGYRF